LNANKVEDSFNNAGVELVLSVLHIFY